MKRSLSGRAKILKPKKGSMLKQGSLARGNARTGKEKKVAA
jgi:hypothetical protein